MSTYAPAASQLAGTGVPLGPLPRPAVMPDAIPIGSVLMWMTSTGPDNWMICNGTAISREEYKELFALIGTTYGSGDGSHTFNLPDLRDRFPVGLGSQTGTNALGETGGGTTHTHSIASHAHTGAPHTHAVSGSTASHYHTCDNHTHQMSAHQHTVIGSTGYADSGLSTQSGAGATRTGQAHYHDMSFWSGTPSNNSTTGYEATQYTDWKADSFSVTSGAASFSGNTGGSGILTTDAGTSYPPYLTLHYIIKVK